MAISIRGVAAPIEITSIHRICSSIAANQVVINRPAIAAVDATFWRALRLVEGASSVASLIDSFFCFSIRGFLNSCHLAVAFLEKFNYGLSWSSACRATCAALPDSLKILLPGLH